MNRLQPAVTYSTAVDGVGQALPPMLPCTPAQVEARLAMFELGQQALAALRNSADADGTGLIDAAQLGDLQLWREAEQSHRYYWLTDEGLTSELEFHQRMFHLVHRIFDCYMAGDIQEMLHLLQRILWVEDWITGEPQLSTYETGLVHAALPCAKLCADRFLIDSGYAVLQQSAAVLQAKLQRRELLGLPFRPDSEAWYRLYEILAALKWKGSVEQLELLLTPDELIEEYLHVEQRCLDYLAKHPSSHAARVRQVQEDLAECLLQLIKMVIRWQPSRSGALIAHFNSLHGPVLSGEAGHFLRHKPLGTNTAWYYDLEVFKWCVSGPATPEDALLCHQWRLDAFRAQSSPGNTLKSLRDSAYRELQVLLGSHSAEIQSPGGERRAG